jgi:hypothetical protein
MSYGEPQTPRAPGPPQGAATAAPWLAGLVHWLFFLLKVENSEMAIELLRGGMIVFGSIAAIVFGSVLIYKEAIFYKPPDMVGTASGVFLFSAGITALWVKKRLVR